MSDGDSGASGVRRSGAAIVRAARRLAFVAASLLAIGFAADARADVVLVLAPTGSEEATSEGVRAVARIRDRITADGFVVRIASESVRDRALALMSCEQRACVAAGLDSLRVDYVVAPAYWSRANGARELSLEAVGRDLDAFVSTEVVMRADADVNVAADRTADRMLAWMPAPRRVEPLEAVASEMESDATSEAPRRVSGWNYALGTGMIAASAVPLALGLVAFARDGECVDVRDDGTCQPQSDHREVIHFGPRSKAMVGAGIVAVVGGVVLIAARPIRVRARASTTSVVLDSVWSF